MPCSMPIVTTQSSDTGSWLMELLTLVSRWLPGRHGDLFSERLVLNVWDEALVRSWQDGVSADA